MINQIFMSKSSMFAFQRKMQVIAANIANSQTVGYKKRRAEMESLFPLIFESTLTESDENVGSGVKRKKYTEYGTGVRIVDVGKDFSEGTLDITNQPLDMAIDGRGFFQIRMPDGSLAYTRSGNFHLNFDGMVVDQNGHSLEPPIQIPRNATDIVINEEGRVFVQMSGQTVPSEIGQLLLGNFQNPEGLKDVGQNLYAQTPASGDPTFEMPGLNGVGFIRQRSLEFSNVNVIAEMMDMIVTQRSFELIVKTIQAGEAMLKASSDLGK